MVSGFVPQDDITNAARRALQNDKSVGVSLPPEVKRWYDRKASKPTADVGARERAVALRLEGMAGLEYHRADSI